MMDLKNKIGLRSIQFSHKIFVEEKLNNPLGYIILSLIAIVLGYLMATQTVLGLGLVGAFIGLFAILICMINPATGLSLNVGYSFFAFHFSRFLFHDSFPVGVVSDVLVVSTWLGVFMKRRSAGLQFPPSPVFTFFLILYGYDLLEFFNPYAHSFFG
jgi:hypothetical protein